MADQTIDKLQVEVTATAKGTNAIFNQLEAQMRALKRALDAIDVSKLTTLNKATASVKPKIDTSGLTKAETDAQNSVNKIQQALAGLVAYADKAKLGDSSMMTSFERKATSVQSAIDALDAKFKQMGEIKLPTEAFSKVQAEMEKTESHLESLKRQQQEMKDSGYNPAVSQSDKWDDLVAKLKLAEEEFIRLKAIQDGLVNSGNAFTYPLDAYKEALGSTRAQLEQLVSATRAAFDATQQKPDNSGLDDTKNKAEEATAALRKMFQQATSRLSDKLKSSLKKIASSLLSIKDAASKAADKGFMKLLKYGFGIRSIYVLFRRLRKVVVDSFVELQNSGAFFETTRANVTNLKTSLATLKYQFGAAFEPIFNAVAPALTTFVNKLVEAMNAISAFMARLTGNSTYSKVKWVNTATGEAAKNAKELNKQLQKFDELNNLTTNKGGSGSGSGDAAKAVYEEASVESALGDFGKKLADLIRAGEWYEVGKTISDKLSEAMESIDWESIYKKASNFGKGFADFLNGLINPRLFENIGTTIGNSIKTGLIVLNDFGKEFDWKNFGESIAAGFNAWLKAGNIAMLGEVLHTWFAGALDAAIEFFENADFEELGKQIAEFISNLDIPDLAKKLARLAILILKALGEAIASMWSNSDVTGKLVMGIVGVLLALNFAGKLGGLATLIMSALGGSFGTTGLTGAIGTSLSSSLAGQTISVNATGLNVVLGGASVLLGSAVLAGGTYLASNVQNNPFAFDSQTGKYDWMQTLGGIAAQGLGTATIGGGISKLLGNTFAAGFTKVLPAALGIFGAQVLGSYGGNQIGKNWWSAIGREDIASAYDEWLGFGIDPIKTIKGYADIFEGIKTGNFGDAWNNMWGDVGEWFYDWHQQNRQSLKEWGTELLQNYFGGDAEAVLKKISETSTGIGAAWNNVVSNVNQATNAYKGLGSVTNDVGNKTKELVSHTTKFGDEAANSSNKVTNGFGKIPETLKNIFSKAYTSSTNTWNGLGGWAKNKVSDVSNGFNSVTTNVPNKFSDAYTKSTSKWSSLGSWATEKSSQVDNAFNQFPSRSSTQFGNAYTQSTSKWSGLGAWANSTLEQVNSAATNKLNQVPSKFNNSFQQGTSQAKSQINSFSSWFNSLKFEKKATMRADENSFSSVKSKYQSLVNDLKDKQVNISVNATGFSTISSQITALTSQLQTAKTLSSTLSNTSRLTSTSNYSSGLRYFASGGIVSGAMQAVVGEAGPEAILPLTDGTLGSLAHLIVGEMATPQMASVNSNISGYYGSSDAVAEQNQLLREEVQLLRQIAGKELTISSKEIFEANRIESNNYYNRTGNSPNFF